MKTIKARRSSFRRSALGALVLAACTAASASAATIRGATDAAALWVSAPGAVPAPTTVEMRNSHRTFIPPFVIIAEGSSVRFPNDDPFYHSIYSASKADPFDIGYYGPGPGKSVAFPNPGIDQVHCHIHASMHAVIVVADGPFAQSSGGRYEIDGVPAGTFVLHAWDPTHGERSMTVVVPAANATVTKDVRAR